MLGVLGAFCAPNAEAQQWGRPQVPHAGACFYRDADFGGDYFCATAGNAIAALPPGMNDQISSVRTFGSAVVTIFQDGRFHGRSQDFAGDVRNLRGGGWNDRISSVRVATGFWGGGGHYSGNPDSIVRRAYQDILLRTPDAEGYRLYRGRITNEGWSEQQVREALRDSPEYRTKFR
jgi:hypothetical protein